LSRKQPKGLLRLGAPEYFNPQTLASLLGQFTQRYPAVKLEIEMGIGPDIAAQFAKGRYDLAIVNREIGEGEGEVLLREGRVWAAAKSLMLEPQAPLPLALFPPHCAWRRLALEELDKANRPWTVVLQSAGVAGLTAAVEAGLAVSLFAQSNLPSTLKALGAAEGLPALPEFEYVLKRKNKASLAATRLAEVIVDYFQLSATLLRKRTPGQNARA
jgi:DNA-binding transcriptional LysR family regulator